MSYMLILYTYFHLTGKHPHYMGNYNKINECRNIGEYLKKKSDPFGSGFADIEEYDCIEVSK